MLRFIYRVFKIISYIIIASVVITVLTHLLPWIGSIIDSIGDFTDSGMTTVSNLFQNLK